MFTRGLFFISILVCLVGTANPALADVPQLINYQGILLDDIGDPVTIPVNVIFAIWNAEIDGDSLWSEQQAVSPNENGQFSVLLGSASPVPDSTFAGAAWLSTKVEADPEMIPRSQLVSSGYAYRVSTVDGATGGTLLDKLIVTGIGEDSVKITPIEIVIRGPGGDEQAVYAASGMTYTGTGDALRVYDSEGDMRVKISVDQEGGAITLYESSAARLPGEANQGGRKVEFREGGLLLYGATDADTVCHLFPNGNIVGKGQLAMGDNHGTSGTWSNVAGYNNEASGDSSVVCGGYENIASGPASAVVGGSNNIASGISATVGGGHGNDASVNYATVPGGLRNTASGGMSTAGGGYLNIASDACATVGGGRYNNAGNEDATVSGGRANSASGWGATIPGGAINKAYGAFSFAAGYRARAEHDGAFVWGDSTDANLSSSAPNQFRARASGGVWFYTNSAMTTGVTVPAGGGAWSSLSNRELKRNIRPVDGAELLEKLAQLEVSRWSYKTQDEGIEHIGPMAQDFYRLFGVGDNNTTISTIDPDGIALAAIQELHQQNQEQQEENAELKERVEQLETLVKKLLEDKE